MTKDDVPPICNLCKRVKQPLLGATRVPGQGAVYGRYWWCETCDTGQPSRPRA